MPEIRKPEEVGTSVAAQMHNMDVLAGTDMLPPDRGAGYDHAAARNQFLYTQLADSIERRILEGALGVGDKLPSVRSLSTERGISISTVLQAYALLEMKGLVGARSKSGFYVAPFRRLPPPSTSGPSTAPQKVNVTNFIVDVLRNLHNPRLVPFGITTLSPAWLPASKLNACMRRMILKSPMHSSKYEALSGNWDLRRHISRLALAHGCDISAEEVVITCGAMEALNLALRAVVKAGDTVAVESPTYFLILQLLESMQVKALEIPTCPIDGMDLDELENAVRKHEIKAIVTMPTCQNPLGYVLSDERKKRMLAIANRHGIPIVEDEVYADLAFSDPRPRPIKAFDTKGQVILLSSFSKTLGPGLRVGWIHAGRYQEKVEVLKSVTSLATSTLSQLALAEFMETGAYQRHLRSLRRKLSDQACIFSAAIAEFFPPETRISRPRGGYVLWVELPKGIDGKHVYREAFKEGIGILPGSLFSAGPTFSNCIRITCGHRWTSHTERSLQKLGNIIKRLAARK